MALAQDAVNRHLKKIKPGGLLVVDSDLAQEVEKGNFQVLSFRHQHRRQEMGSVVVANLILLGGLLKKTAVLSVGPWKSYRGQRPAKAKR